ncbi:hypothetical protein F5X96DRAFT_642908 [Biscogniauxia mediterranea]|nr:hypothetical protein F5X96DRAFT_642908 [Biscogniauxia mediterranea]
MASATPAPAPAPASIPGPASESTYKPRYIDIGINLADPIFRGQYHGTQRHPDDLDAVISRAKEVGCTKLIVTGSDFKSSQHALEIAKEYPGVVYTTAGIHPCSSSIFSTTHAHVDTDGHTMPCDPDPSQPVSEEHEPDPEKTEEVISKLRQLIERGRSTHPAPLVAFGEFGLDYDRLHFCSKKVQLHSFAAQLALAASLQPQLPLFLHSRAAHGDFVAQLKAVFGQRLERLEKGGVVHSFTGTVDEMRELMDLGLHVGTNGCSFKTADNCAVVREIRLDRLMLETDGPWCEVRPTHEGWKYLIEPKQPAPAPTSAPAPATTPETPSNPDQQQQEQQQPARKNKKQQQQQQQQKNKKKEPEVPERWKTVKKEKWVEGAMVKGRNEPCMIERVAKIVAAVKGVPVEDVCEAAWRNTTHVFDLED